VEPHPALQWLSDCFRTPPVEVMAQRELAAARRSLLEHERMRDYHENIVAFQRKRIASLHNFLRNNE
jgi:hypothetical protein